MQRRLAELDSARKQFIANASHELRTPIFSLGGFVELLEEEDPSPEERAEFVHTMREQIVRLTKLTADLLDLSQLDAGAVAMKSNNVDLGSLAREVAREFGPRADRHGSRLELRTPDLPVIASADPDRVRQVIRILLDNALTHTPEGTKVTVTTYSVNRRAELTVSDDGPGIPRRVHSRIFERFYTADSAGGSGLGLAIARELAQRMEGRVAIASSKRFTAFTLDLPRSRTGVRRAHRRRRLQGSGVRAARRWLSRRRCGAGAGRSPGCGGGGDGGDVTPRQTATVTEAAPQVVVQTAEHGFDAAEVFREASPGVVTIRSIFRGGGGAAEGSGFVLDSERPDRHQRPRRHRRIQRRPQAGQGSLRRVPRSQHRRRRRSSASIPSPTSPCSRSSPTASTCTRCSSATTATSSSASRSRRSAAPSASSSRSRSASSRRPTARSNR